MEIRPVDLHDADQIVQICNHYIKNTHYTFETESSNPIEMGARICETAEDYAYLVAEERGEILGYAYAHEFKSRPAYNHSVEVSVYIKNDAVQKGIGTELYRCLFPKIYQTDVHAIIAGIALPNDASIRLHEKMGMEKVAHFREVGFKLGRWIDVAYWEMIIT